jgi:hypothetical protein
MIYLDLTVWTPSFETGCARLILTIGAKDWCAKNDVALLGDVPLHAQICHDADIGKPTVVANPEGAQAKAFHAIVEGVARAIGLDER